jgi:hypothetical protein
VLTQFKKLCLDTTQVNGIYVAKDVRNWIAFANGIVLSYLAAIKNPHIHNEFAWAGAGALLTYSLGAAVAKSYFQTKTTQIASDSSCAPSESAPSPGRELVE